MDPSQILVYADFICISLKIEPHAEPNVSCQHWYCAYGQCRNLVTRVSTPNDSYILCHGQEESRSGSLGAVSRNMQASVQIILRFHKQTNHLTNQTKLD